MSTPPPMVSIIIICYNYERYIEDAVKSVRAQAQNWECIIVDNSSSDRTVEIARQLTAGDSRFQIHIKPNEGPAAARNFGYKYCHPASRFVHWLDGDDRLNPVFLDETIGYLNSHPAVGLLGVQFRAIDSNGKDLGSRRRSRWQRGLIFPRKIPDSQKRTPFEVFFCATGQGPFSVFRRATFDQTKQWTESMWTHEDSDMFCQMALLQEVHYLSSELYEKREHNASITASRKRNHYSEFRHKWDNFRTGAVQNDILIQRARWWYYHRHRPLRDLRVALKTIRQEGRRIFSSRGQWATVCLKNAFFGFFLGNHRLANRWR